MNQISRRRLGSAAGIALFALTSAWVAAQSGPGTTNALIPYQGQLQLAGQPVDTPVHMRVGLFVSNLPNIAACLVTDPLVGCGVWADEMQDVEVRGGSFSLLLGSGLPLPDDVFANGALYLGVAVAAPGGPFVVMNDVQRLTSVPFAVRSETSTDLYVSGAVGIGADPSASTPMQVVDDDNDLLADIARFFSADGGSGLGIGPDRIAAVGADSQDIVLAPNSGDVVVEGGLHVEGGLRVDGSIEGVQVALRNTDGVVDSYTKSGRYLVVATYQDVAFTRRYVEIPQHVLIGYCGDEDGCTVRIGMRDFDTFSSSTSMGPFSFFYGEADSVSGVRRWRRAETLTTTSTGQNVHVPHGIDGADGVQHVVEDFDCYFTDGFYPLSGTGTDQGLGMGLLNFKEAPGYTPDCWLSIDD